MAKIRFNCAGEDLFFRETASEGRVERDRRNTYKVSLIFKDLDPSTEEIVHRELNMIADRSYCSCSMTLIEGPKSLQFLEGGVIQFEGTYSCPSCNSTWLQILDWVKQAADAFVRRPGK